MSHLYPSLHERFRSEGLCPICLMEMAHSPRFSCNNGHVICHRCRPYYYSCPNCLQQLNEIPAPVPSPYEPPSLTHFMPHYSRPNQPTAPDLQEFHNNEWQGSVSQHLNHVYGKPPSLLREDQQLLECPYTYLGCSAKFVPVLRDMHVSRCQYKHHSSEECDVSACPEPEPRLFARCRYESVGCNVRAPIGRLKNHEELCIYKNRASVSEQQEELSAHLEGSCNIGNNGDPNRMIDCQFHHRGCMVRMPYWHKETHESKCNNKGYGEYSMASPGYGQMRQPDYDPDQQTDCRWAGFGCRVRPKYYSREQHEAKCNYRMEECTYKNRGCNELMQPSRRYAHERNCAYAY